jgi:hypothetical protein
VSLLCTICNIPGEIVELGPRKQLLQPSTCFTERQQGTFDQGLFVANFQFVGCTGARAASGSLCDTHKATRESLATEPSTCLPMTLINDVDQILYRARRSYASAYGLGNSGDDLVHAGRDHYLRLVNLRRLPQTRQGREQYASFWPGIFGGHDLHQRGVVSVGVAWPALASSPSVR